MKDVENFVDHNQIFTPGPFEYASLRSLNPFVILKITRFLQKFITFLLFRPYALCIYDQITPHALERCLRR